MERSSMRHSCVVRCLLACLLGVAATLSSPAEEVEPKAVLLAVAPSVAVVRDAAIETTGVVMDADGLILTGLTLRRQGGG